MSQSDILKYLPPVFAEIREMVEHAKAQNQEIDSLWGACERAYDDQFLYEMTENGVIRWEKMLGIVPLGTDNLEDRRFRIINRLNAQLPYTMRMLEAKLTQMCGPDGYTMEYMPEMFKLKIRVSLYRRNQFNDIKALLYEMIPLNIELDYDIQYNKHSTLTKYTHGFLSQYTHKELMKTRL